MQQPTVTNFTCLKWTRIITHNCIALRIKVAAKFGHNSLEKKIRLSIF